MFKWCFLYLSICLLPPVLSLDTTEWEESGTIFSLPYRIFIYCDKIPLSLFFSRLNNPSSLSLCSYDRCSRPLIIFVPTPLSAKLSGQLSPSLYWYMRLFLPMCRTLHFPLLNFSRFLSALFSSLSRSFWMVAWLSGVSSALLILCHLQTCWRCAVSIFHVVNGRC